MKPEFWMYLLVMGGVTYLLRMVPLALVRRKIRSRFLRSFLYYVPYAVLTAMTVPAVFSATRHVASAAAGFVAALIVALRGKKLVAAAAAACAAVYLTELLIFGFGA